VPELTESDAKKRIEDFFNKVCPTAPSLYAKIFTDFAEKMGIPELLVETYRQACNDTLAEK